MAGQLPDTQLDEDATGSGFVNLTEALQCIRTRALPEAVNKPTDIRSVNFTLGRFLSASIGNTCKNKGPR